MENKSESYKVSECCGADCDLLGCRENEPCWGEVDVVDECCTEDYSDCWWVHACEGHRDTVTDGKAYIPEPKEKENVIH
jgi:hypothetical protein